MTLTAGSLMALGGFPERIHDMRSNDTEALTVIAPRVV